MTRILLIVGGGIAAYKAAELIRLLKTRGYAVRCVMTEAEGHERWHMHPDGWLSGGYYPLVSPRSDGDNAKGGSLGSSGGGVHARVDSAVGLDISTFAGGGGFANGTSVVARVGGAVSAEVDHGRPQLA